MTLYIYNILTLIIVNHRHRNIIRLCRSSYAFAVIAQTTQPAFGPESGLRKMVLIATSLVKAYYIMCLVIIHLINDHEAHYIVICKITTDNKNRLQN